MLFTSLQWLVFLATVFVAHHLAPRALRKWLLLASSIAFYASWSVPYLALIFFQLTIDWVCGHLLGTIQEDSRRRRVVALSVVVNLGVLCVFKYYGFFARNLYALGLQLPPVELELPLGISFYTFESMSYTIDVYRRRLAPVRSPLHLALFITWFPHLVAGPIVRPSELIPQFDTPAPLTRERFFRGASLMLVGYSKKLLVADWLAKVAEPAFAAPRNFTSLELAAAAYAYAFQIFCDFSAYTDIARGASLWFGIELPDNFDDPYLSTSITDFWRRWHMTLSHWLRDYLYISLGGNRKGPARTYFNLAATMILGGLWHGASWTFVAWGALHGVLLAVERAFGWGGAPRTSTQRWGRTFVTFHLVCLAWIFFRAPDFEVAWAFLRGLARFDLRVGTGMVVSVLGTVFLIALYWLARPLRKRVLDFDPGDPLIRQLGWTVAVGVFLSVLTVFASSTSTFVYFQF